MTNIIDHGHDDPIPFELTPAERDAAAFAQAQLRLDAIQRNARDRRQERQHEARGQGATHA